MILDKENKLSAAQVITTGSDTGLVSTNSFDLGNPALKQGLGGLGVGELLRALIQVTTLFAHGGSATAVDVELVEADDDALTSNVAVLQKLGTFSPTAAAGSRIVANIDPIHPSKRYIGFKYTAQGAALTAGAVDAYLVKDIDAYKAFQDNVVIS